MSPAILRRFLLAVLVMCAANAAWAEEKIAPQRFALLVGVNEYEHNKLKPLHFAENDVSALAAVLKAAKYQVTLLVTKSDNAELKPTKANIEKQLGQILQKCRKGDSVIVAFSGHGLQFEGQPDAYFCPVDARPFNTNTDSLVSIGKVYGDLDKSFAATKVLLVDACRDDPATGRGVSRGVSSASAPPPPQGVAALFSCGAGEQAFESPKLKHGVFFYHVIEGLKGSAADSDHEVTFASLASYVSRRVRRDVSEIIGDGAKQSPNLKADYNVEPILVPVMLSRTDEVQLSEDWKEFQRRVLKSSQGDFFSVQAAKQIDLWLRAADMGDARAQVLVGNYLNVQNPKQNRAAALALFHQAADQDEPEGMYMIGCYCGRTVERDRVELANWFRKAAERGCPRAQYQLGLCFKWGTGVKKDEKEALEWIRKSADQDFIAGVSMLGQFLADGFGATKDEVEAVKCFRKAAIEGFEPAQERLAKMLDEGRGVEKNPTEAVKWYRILAQKNHIWTNFRLALMLVNGIGVAQDDAEAVKWLRPAAQYGIADAERFLGFMLESGRGVQKDMNEAVAWYKKAAAQGHELAKSDLARLGIKQ